MSKLGALSADGIVDVPYWDQFERQWVDWRTRRIVVAPAANPTRVLEDLLRETWEPPYHILYILSVSRCDQEPGRYQMTRPVDGEGLRDFLARHRAYLEGDSRHDLWIAPAGRPGQIVYDRHDLLYCYGRTWHFERWLLRRGFSRGPVTLPQPHVHRYEPAFDPDEVDILTRWFWHRTPLQESDE